MKAPLRPPASDDEEKRAMAGFILHAHLAGRRLPEHLGDVPDRMLVDRLARMEAKELLATLQQIYGVDWWDREAFKRVFVEGAIQGWKPGTLVQQRPTSLRIVSTTCPIAADVETDKRACEMCQAVQRHAAYLALIGQVEDVAFARVMADGESACEMSVRFRR